MAKVRLRIYLAVLAVMVSVFAFALVQVTGKPVFALVAVAFIFILIALALALYVLSTGLAIAIHELGHYFAGRAVGFQFQRLVAGPIGYRMEAGRLVRYRVRPAKMYGYVVMTPVQDTDVQKKYRLFILGGPVISIAWTALIIWAWRMLGFPLMWDLPRHTDIFLVIASFAATTCLVSTIGVLPGTLVPYRVKRMGGFPTDMLWLWILRQDSDEARRLIASMTLSRLLLSGMRAKDLPEGVILEAVRKRDGTIAELFAVSVQWAYAVHHDLNVAQTAIKRHEEILGTLQDTMIDPWRSTAKLLEAENAVFVNQDYSKGCAWLEGVTPLPDPSIMATSCLVRAGLAALDNSADRAVRLDEAAEAIAEAGKRTTISWEGDLEWIERLRKGWPGDSQTPPPRY